MFGWENKAAAMAVFVLVVAVFVIIIMRGNMHWTDYLSIAVWAIIFIGFVFDAGRWIRNSRRPWRKK